MAYKISVPNGGYVVIPGHGKVRDGDIFEKIVHPFDSFFQEIAENLEQVQVQDLDIFENQKSVPELEVEKSENEFTKIDEKFNENLEEVKSKKSTGRPKGK